MTVEEAIAHFESVTKLAEAIGVHPAAVSNWKRRGQIPIDSQCRIQIASKGKLKADQFKTA